MGDNKNSKKLEGLLANIKIEPGTSTPGRLPSFRGARDLTLGAWGPGKANLNDTKQRKIYKPNTNAQRNKNKDEVKLKEQHPKGRKNERGRGPRPHEPRASKYVQSAGGVFSEGFGELKKKRGSRSSNAEKDSDSGFIPKPKLNLQFHQNFDKEEEEMQLKELLRDDFIDDPSIEIDPSNAPVGLPLLKIERNIEGEFKKEYKSESKKEIGFDGVEIKQEKLDEASEVKIKTEPMWEDEFITDKSNTFGGATLSELFLSKGPELVFMQLPDTLPGLKPEEPTEPSRPSTSAKPSTSSGTASQNTTNEDSEIPENNFCKLKNLSEGFIGKIQLLKSGRARLVLGETILHLEMGTNVGFRQDLICVNLDPSTYGGDMINLGPVNSRLVCSPDLEMMLAVPNS